MRLASYEHQGSKHTGVVVGEAVHPLDDVVPKLVGHGGWRMLMGQAPLSLDHVRLLAPLEPSTIRDFVAFEQHVEGVAGTVPGEWYMEPKASFGNPYAVVGAHDNVPIPRGCEVFDFGLEVAAVVSKAGRDLTPEQARSHIMGYTVLNGWSARDTAGCSMKGHRSMVTLGPWLVTADEVEPHRKADGFLDLTMSVERNGRQVGSDTTANMAWTFEELIAHASRGAGVRAGDVVSSGVCGFGCLAELWGRSGERRPPPLRPGETITMSVEGLGTISNTVVSGAEFPPLPRARRRDGPRC